MSCEKIAYLIDKGEVEELSKREKRRVKWHLLMCKLCTRYQDDSKALSKMFRRLADRSEQKILSEAEKERLNKAITDNS